MFDVTGQREACLLKANRGITTNDFQNNPRFSTPRHMCECVFVSLFVPIHGEGKHELLTL